MSVDTESARTTAVELPTSAPQVRVTAGVGSAAQKTWNLRRPITLIGSRRPAHIMLHDRDVSHAHCVIVNTGRDILLKDLKTSSGTLCNNVPIDLTALKDGDVITVGANRIQVAIHVPEDACDDSACGMAFTDPLRFPTPVTVGLLHTDQEWNLVDAVALIGRHTAARILLDNEEVSRRHALIFRFQEGPAVFDLGGRGGIWLNGKQCTLARLYGSDRLTVGPFGLHIDTDGPLGTCPATEAVEVQEGTANGSPDMCVTDMKLTEPTAPATSVEDDREAITGLDHTDVEAELDVLQGKIAQSWNRLNAWQSQLASDTEALDKQDEDLASRVAELDARDAALRGQLHDVTQYYEQLTQRERELLAESARLQEQMDGLTTQQSAVTRQEADLTRKTEELTRREHVLAQRWSRLHAATCPHCHKPVGTGVNGQT